MMIFSARRALLATTTLITLTTLSANSAQAQIRTTDNVAGANCNGGAACTVLGFNATPAINVNNIPGTNPEIIVDSDTRLVVSADLTAGDGNVAINLAHDISSNGALTVVNTITGVGAADAVITVDDNVEIQRITINSGGGIVTQAGSTATGIKLLGADSWVHSDTFADRGIDVASGATLSVQEGSNAIDMSLADTYANIVNIDVNATLQGNILFGQGDLLVFTDSTGGAQTQQYYGDIVGDSGGGTETVRINAAGDTVNLYGELRDVDTVDIAAGALGFGSTFGDVNGRTQIDGGITMGNDTRLSVFGPVIVDANITGSNGDNELNFYNTSRLGDDGDEIISLLGGNDEVTIQSDARIFAATLDLGAGNDVLNFNGNSDAVNSIGDINVNIIGGAGSDRISVSRSDATDNARFNGDISGIENFWVSTGHLIFDADATIADSPTITMYNTGNRVVFGNTAGANLTNLDIRGTTSEASFNAVGAVFNTDITDSNGGNDDQTVEILNGTLNSAITLSGGTNQLNIQNGTFTGSYTSAGGTDTVTLASTGTMTNATLTDADGTGSTFEVNKDFEVDNTIIIDGFAIDIDNNSTFTVTDNTGLGSNTDLASITVQSGSTLKGTGTIRNAGGTFTNNGTYAPGNSVGTQIITGNFIQGAGGTLDIEFDNSGIDLVDITGTASLAGTLNLIELGAGATLNTPLVFLEADGGVTGTFNPVNRVFLMGTEITEATVGYDANSAFLTLSSFNGLDTSASTTTQSGSGVSASINAAADNNPSQNVVDVVNALEQSDDLGNALESQGNIVVNASTGQANTAMGQVVNVVRARMTGAEVTTTDTGVSSGNEYYSSGNYWVQAVGGWSDIDSDSNGLGSKTISYGGAVGLEFVLGDSDTTLGVFAGYTFSETDVNQLRDKGEVGNYQLGVYGTHSFDNNWRVNGTLSASYLDFETSRSTSQGTATADFDGYAGYATTELAYDIKKENYMLSPFGAIEASFINRDSYTESGAGVLNNDVESETTKYLSSVIGMEVSGDFTNNTNEYRFIPSARIGWAHQFLDDSATTKASFSQAPAIVFETQGPERSRDSMRLGLDLEFSQSDNDSVVGFARYDGDITSDAQAHSVRLGVAVKF